MEQYRSSMIKSLVAIAFGLILILWPNSSFNTLIIIVGVLFITLGIFLIANSIKKQQKNDLFPILTGIVSLGIGVIFVVIPQTLSNVIFYIVAVFFIVGGIYQLIRCLSNRVLNASVWTYVFSVFLIVLGILIFLFPDFMSASLFIILGAAILIYGIRGLFIWYKS